MSTFLKVASLQNFTQASQELGYSQSNVSAQIKQLELEMGKPLFDRIGRGVFLTSYGEALVPFARQIVSAVLQMENFSKSEGSLGGRIRVGMSDSLFELLLEKARVNYHRRFPRVKLELTLEPTAVLESRLQQGLLDAACMINDPMPESEWQVWNVLEVPIVLAVNPQHPLAGKAAVEPEEIAEQEMILMESSAPYSLQFQQFLERRHLACRPFLRLQSADGARRLVEREPAFLSVLPLYTVQASVLAGRLRLLSLRGWSETQFIQLVLHRSKALTPQIRGFIDELGLILTDVLAERLLPHKAGQRPK